MTEDAFDIDLTNRTATHKATGASSFSFYEYDTEEDWLASDVVTVRPTKDHVTAAQGLALAPLAKAAALAAGMKATKP